MDLSFLKDVQLDVVSKIAPAPKQKIEHNPKDADIRVFANGRIFPGEDFVKDFNLEYQNKEIHLDGITIINGNGLDVFSSLNWGMLKDKLPEELIFVSAVSKASPKVDLWGSTKYNEDNTPKASVITQGAMTFGKKVFVPMLTEVYGINWDTTQYVDLNVAEQTITSENGVYHIPKVIAGGKKKGQSTYIRRENIEIHPLIVVHVEDLKKAPQLELFVSEEEGAPELAKESK